MDKLSEKSDNAEIVFLRMPEMMRRTGLSRAAIYCKANPKDRRFDPHFPNCKNYGYRYGVAGKRSKGMAGAPYCRFTET